MKRCTVQSTLAATAAATLTLVRYGQLVCLVLLVSTCLPWSAHAAGFDSDYTATAGDLNGDGLQDLYLKAKREIQVIPIDDLVVPLPVQPEVAAFVLQRRPDQTFQVVSNLTAAQRSMIAQWPAAAVILQTMDINMDGVLDILVTGIPNTDPTLVFANPQSRTPPLTALAVNSQLRTFLSDIHKWSFDPARIVEVKETGWYALYDLSLAGFLFNGLPITGNLFDPGTLPDACIGFS